MSTRPERIEEENLGDERNAIGMQRFLPRTAISYGSKAVNIRIATVDGTPIQLRLAT